MQATPRLKNRFTLLICLLATIAAGCSTRGGPVPNFHPVNDRLYRGGQPTAAGFRQLRDRYGVATVVNLDGRTAADERAIVDNLGMNYVSVPLRARGLDMPHLREALAAMRSSAGPVFVHCRAGMDRTGAAVAGYRIAYDGWTVDRALRELRTCREPWHGLLYPNVSDAVRGVADGLGG